jgi:holo-[acyl-carrier protein] synthase
MIVGIGCDIVDHETSKKLRWDSDVSIINRIFSRREIDIYLSNKELRFLCGRFAAKEAVLKSLGTGMQDGIALTDIQIVQSQEKRPVIELFGTPKELSDRLGIDFWHISITHSSQYSTAFVIAETLKH